MINLQYLDDYDNRTEYRKEVLAEIARREATYGRKKKNDDDDLAAKEQKEKEQKEQDEDEFDSKPKDIYALSMPEFGV